MSDDLRKSAVAPLVDAPPTDAPPTDAPPTDAAARRGARRKRVLKGARLVLGGGMSTIDCAIKDISATGARVRLADVTPLTGHVRLAMPDGEILDAEVTRNVGVEVGLRFLGDRRPSLAPPPDELELVIADLEDLPIDALILRLTSLPEHGDEEVAEATRALRLAKDTLVKSLRSRVTGW